MAISFLSFPKRKRREFFGVLDVGSQNVKVLCVREEGPKKIILGKTLKEYERFGVFDGREFELDVMRKAISGAVKELEKTTKVRIENLIVGLPAHIFKARIASQTFKRTHPEKNITKQEESQILDVVVSSSREKAAEEFSKKTGILPQELRFLSTHLLGVNIDGYSVSKISGFKGQNIKLKVLITFLPIHYLESVENLISASGFKILKIAHESEGLIRALSRDRDALFLDIGADFTQIFLVRQGDIEKISDFKIGGQDFLVALYKQLGISYDMVKDLAERYQRGLLEEQTRARLRKIFWQEAQNWYFNLEKEINDKATFGKIFCFGGGAYYSEIMDVLEKNYEVSATIFNPKDLPNIEDRTETTTNLQFTPSILLIFADRKPLLLRQPGTSIYAI